MTEQPDMNSTKGTLTFKKVAAKSVLYRSAYEVFYRGKSIGFVWSRKELSYRGMQGWNRGIRLHDFHPVRWKYGSRLGGATSRFSQDRRIQAAKSLLSDSGIVTQ